MTGEAYIEALTEAFDLAGLKQARTDVALNLATRSARSLEINLKRTDGRETSAIVVATYEEKLAFLTACRAAIAKMEGTDLPELGGLRTDFSNQFVDP